MKQGLVKYHILKNLNAVFFRQQILFVTLSYSQSLWLYTIFISLQISPQFMKAEQSGHFLQDKNIFHGGKKMNCRRESCISCITPHLCLACSYWNILLCLCNRIALECCCKEVEISREPHPPFCCRFSLLFSLPTASKKRR